MSTAVATRPIYHTITWGKHTWVCVNPHCNGYQHVYVARTHAR